MEALDTLIIVNPVAGHGRADRVFRSFSSGDALTNIRSVRTSRCGEATEISREAVKCGVKRILCFGGDGTIHEIINALINTETELAIIPVGTGNDLARTLGISFEPTQALQRALASKSIAEVDAASVNDRFFVNVAGTGIDAHVAKKKNEIFRFCRGSIPFIAATLSTLVTYRGIPLTITHDNGVLSGRAMLAAVGNGKYYAGGMKIAPNADPCDGLLDVVVAWHMGRLESLLSIPRVYRGTHLSKPNVCTLRTTSLTIDSPEPAPVQAEGEIVASLPVKIDIIPRALRIIV